MDSNWEKMAVILDKEMPVKKERRRIIPLWWWYAAVLLPFIICTYSNFDLSRNKVESFSSQNNGTINDQQRKETAGLNVGDKSTINTENESNDIIVENIEHTAIRANGEEVVSPILFTSSVNPNQNTADQLLSANEQVIIIDTKQENVRTIGHEEQIMDKTNTNSHSEEPRDILDVPILSSSIAELMVLNQANIPALQLNLGENGWKYGAEMAMSSHNFRNIMTASIGVVSSYNLTPKWHLDGMLNWTRYHYSSPFYSSDDVIFQSSSKSLEFEDTQHQNIYVNEDYVSISRQYVLSKITEHLDYAELSLGVGYRLHSNIRCNLMFSTGMNISSKYQPNSDADLLIAEYSNDRSTKTLLSNSQNLHKNWVYKVKFGLEGKVYKNLFIVSRADIFTQSIIPQWDLSKFTAAYTSLVDQQLSNIKNTDVRVGVELGLRMYL